MAILKVARMGHPVLRARAKSVDPAEIASPRIQSLIDSMFETMQEYQGVGLAAPQVHESLRLFVAGIPPRRGEGAKEADDEERVPLMVLINPEIKVVGTASAEDREGLHRSSHPARDGSSKRGSLPRSDDIPRHPYLSREVQPLLELAGCARGL